MDSEYINIMQNNANINIDTLYRIKDDLKKLGNKLKTIYNHDNNTFSRIDNYVDLMNLQADDLMRQNKLREAFKVYFNSIKNLNTLLDGQYDGQYSEKYSDIYKKGYGKTKGKCVLF